MRAVTKSLLKYFAKTARPIFQSYGLLRTANVYNRTALVWEPGAEKVLVLAPHMDDETIGCGGTIARHIKAGASVRIVFLTDGRYGSSAIGKLTGDARAQKMAELIRSRREEARSALAILGVGDMHFLDAEDGKLAEDSSVAGRLREILEHNRPEIVYVPFCLEQHPDHRAASKVLMEATRDSKLDFWCSSYEVWTPLFPNCIVRIDEFVEQKRQAIACYHSQLADSDYIHTGLGLNAYRSSAFLTGYGRFAEAFCCVPLAEHGRLFASCAA